MKRVALLPLAAMTLYFGCTNEPEPKSPPPPSVASATALPPAPTASAAPASGWPADGPPQTAKKPVNDTHHGKTVVDDYRWLEDAKDPAVKQWSDAESAYTRKHLDALAGRDALRARLTELLSSASADHFGLHWAGGKLFALKDQPPKQQPFLVTLKSADDTASEKVLVDPNAIDTKGSTTIDWYVPSPDGKFVAVSLSEGGSESGTLHVYDVATGKEIDTPIPRVHGGTAGGSLTWRKDGKAFWYTRYPREGEKPKDDLDFFQTVWFHEVGKKDDRSSLTKDLPRIAEIELETSHDGRYVLAKVANGDGGEFAFHLLDTKGKQEAWVKVSDFADKVVGAELGDDGGLWLRSIKGAPRGVILRTALAKPSLADAKLVVPESGVVIEGFTVTKGRLYLNDLVGGPSQVRILDLAGKQQGTLPLPPVTSVRQIVAKEGSDDVLVRTQSYTEPPTWYRWSNKKLEKTQLHQTSKADFANVEVVRETCVSKDGTKVPVNILRRKGLELNGNNPTILYGYGGYGVSLQPRFAPKNLPWLEAGGVYAIANLRGGGEFGESWHEDGKLTKKQNVFNDFQACVDHMIETKYTKRERLAIEGGSNGGLLMGAALVQHPDAFAAVVSHVGIYDMLRVETTPNGAFNVTEFGTVKDKAQFDALYAYSPFHNVKDGQSYPAVLFLTGANDPRVDPYHSRKMTARLQAAMNGKGTVLLRTSGDTGHGIGTPLTAQIEEQVDVYSFLGEQLHVQFK
ncbi:MAG: prolyl oligopeptidase family serine peptidase [Polyangiales bacterium]